MIAFDYVEPISLSITDKLLDSPSNIIGNNIQINTVVGDRIDIDKVDIAFFSVEESRDSLQNVICPNFDAIRHHFYRLFPGDWNIRLCDLGHIPEGDSLEETLEATQIVVRALLQKNIIPVILGGTQSLSYAMYRACDNIHSHISLVDVDSRLDFSSADSIISSESYISKLFNKPPLNLFEYTNIGYQSYYNSQEQLDLLKNIYGSAYRLGNVVDNIKLVEPLFRQADIGIIDLFSSVKSADMALSDGLPNGFGAREICALSRYAGLSDRLSIFGVFEIPDTEIAYHLVAQMLWYFVEGSQHKYPETPSENNEQYQKYTVSLDQNDVLFYKSIKTNKWWIVFPEYSHLGRLAVFACQEVDYQQACAGKIPELWYNAQHRLSYL